jgi:hypothetical protein
VSWLGDDPRQESWGELLDRVERAIRYRAPTASLRQMEDALEEMGHFVRRSGQSRLRASWRVSRHKKRRPASSGHVSSLPPNAETNSSTCTSNSAAASLQLADPRAGRGLTSREPMATEPDVTRSMCEEELVEEMAHRND